ncbi:TonB-dependent receptor [Sphingomonas bacterium]|uniref:TonB-dependent receptor n=1 Tax=Sphingomonas bacterium TaxID=1895847 RepID=UPI001575FEF9|nr:TonB-dependent receptor [Sphingomonas bacterium]
MTNPGAWCRLRGTTAILALALASGVARAEAPAGAEPAAPTAESLDPVEDIVVTARRREETAQNVPVALSVVSAEALTRSGSININQIQQLVPSLQVTATNPRNSVINIRGLGANSSIAVDGLEYGVGFYVDGVYYARPGQAQFDLIDLQQIEVLRGPQGTLFGKNTTAGAINVTTRLPSFDPEFVGEATFGTYAYHQVRASGSFPLIDDKLAIRLTFADTHRDGFLTNLYDGSDAQNYDNTTIRGQLLAKPAENLTVRLIGDYARQAQHFALTIFDGYFTTYGNGAPIANNIIDRAARTGYALPSYNAFARLGNSDAPFQANMKSYGVSGQVDWDLGSATLTSVTAYRWWDWYPKNDVDGTSLSINVAGQQINHQRQFSQELRVASDGSHKVDYVAGVYYFWQVVRGYGDTAYGPDYARWNLNPATTPAATIANTNLALNGFAAKSFSNPSTKSYAAFGQLDWHLADRLTLTTGLRYTHENKKGVFNQFWVAGVDPATLPAAQAAAVLATRNAFNPILNFSAKDSADALTGLATLSYKVAPDVLVYGTYSRGNKSGGLNLTAGGAFRPVVDPEKVNAYEIGLKSQFLDRRATLNLAAFNTEIRDYQASITEPIAGTTSVIQYIANIPKVRSRGIEGDFAFAVSRWINLSASAAYADAKYVTFTNSPQAAERLNVSAIQDLSGQRLTNAPKFVYTLAADVAQPIGDVGRFGAIQAYGHADFAHRSSYNTAATNSIYGIIPAYGLVNARIGLRTENGRWDLSIWARNLFDKDYYISRSGANYGLITGLPGEPRTLGVTLRTKL